LLLSVFLFPLDSPHFVASWIVLQPGWVVLNVVPIEVPTCDPSGDKIVTKLRSEMAKNGNIVSDSDSLSWITATWTECPTWDHGHAVVQEGPGGLNLLFP
jgi:hypothetical protein